LGNCHVWRFSPPAWNTNTYTHTPTQQFYFEWPWV